jgi:glycosyltransferase involved in cell wall biosynthesis
MKVLYISSWYPTPGNPNLGVFVKEHARAIKTTSTEIRVLAVVVLRDKPFLKVLHREYIDESGIRTFEIVIQSRLRDIIYHLVPLQNLIAYKYYKKAIEPNFSPDIIHSNVIFPAGIIGDYFARKLKKPHVITEHWSKIDGLLKKPYLSYLARKSYQKASCILPVSQFLKGNMLGLLPDLNPNKFQVISNVISSEIFDYKEKIVHNDAIHFCAVATWATKRNPDKKPELFIEALAEIEKRTSKKIKLTMVGGGDRVEKLKLLCQSLNLDTTFVGYKTKQEIAEILQETDYFVHASTIETFGVVIVEALMTGTPVICSNVGGLPELIGETNGVLCENNVADWVLGINKIIQSDFDKKQMAENVKNRFGYESIGEEIASVYERL